MKFQRWLGVAVCVTVLSSMAGQASAHCQVPCGIYNDPVRFELLKEHVATIEKGMKQIAELSAAETKNYNQIVRWVNNKELHADEFTEIVTYYFLAQRIKPVADPSDKAAVAKYVGEVKMLHEMIVFAMKCKQTTDVENCAKLRSLIEDFEESYQPKPPAQAGVKHTHTHLAGDHQHTHP